MEQYESIIVKDKQGVDHKILKIGEIYLQIENGSIYIYTKMPVDNGDGLGYGQAYEILEQGTV